MTLLKTIQQLSERHAQEVISLRRHIHAHPELSYQEFNTAKFISQKLREFGLKPQESVAQTGVVVLIEGNNPTKIGRAHV